MGFEFATCASCGRDILRGTNPRWQLPPANMRVRWRAAPCQAALPSLDGRLRLVQPTPVAVSALERLGGLTIDLRLGETAIRLLLKVTLRDPDQAIE